VPKPEPLTLDALCADWKIWQRGAGHRFSTDDLLTAYWAARLRPDARRVLDLGCGIGSVLLMLAWRLPGARLLGLEAQAESAALARRSIAHNAADARVTLREGDLRDAAALRPDEASAFDLVTATPPYIPLGRGVLPRDAQKAHARFELRGGLEDYCRAAARALAPDGLLVAVWEAAQEARALAAGAPAGLVPLRLWPIVFRAGQAPLIVLVAYAAAATAAAAPGAAPTPAREAPLLVRDARGHRTAAMIAIRADMGMPAGKPRPGGLY
jgi:tRNA1Val (adenine37-N6)-methyltransferase